MSSATFDQMPTRPSPASHRLPSEILLYIITFASSSLPNAEQPLDSFSTYPRTTRKADFASLSGLSGSCRAYHQAVQKAWFETLYIRERGDWEMAKQLGISAFVKELRVLAPALGKDVPSDAFMNFPFLNTAFIDAHNDFEANMSESTAVSSPHGRTAPIGRYIHVAPRLPSSLRRLWIVNTHGPDIAIIQTIRAFCPRLTELSISRCTQFSPRLQVAGNVGAQCTFWARFPNDHNSYFAAEGIEDYATALASELVPLKDLRTLHMGLYLTPHAAISTHINEHNDKVGNQGLPWNFPCQTCSHCFGAETHQAESAANRIMLDAMPQLRHISWASFFTSNRQEPISYAASSGEFILSKNK